MVKTRKRTAAEAAEAPEGGGHAAEAKRPRRPAAPPPAQRGKSSSSARPAAVQSKKQPSRKATAKAAKKGDGKGKQSKGKTAAGTTTRSAPAAAAAAQPGPSSGSAAPIAINRAPVLTLWAAVVAQRQGFSWDEALTFGKQVSGFLAQSKGRSLGIYEEKERSEAEAAERRAEEEAAGVERVDVFGMRLKAVTSNSGQRFAYSVGKAVTPGSVTCYLQKAFKDRLPDAKAAMEELAAAVPVGELGRVCYKLYERFRPEWRGWGVAGQLDPAGVRQLATTWR